MKTTIEDIQLVSTTKINSLTCDFCGKTTKSKEYAEFEDITSFEINPGFGSAYDFDTFEFEICDHCLKTKLLPLKQKNLRPQMLTDDEVKFLLSCD